MREVHLPAVGEQVRCATFTRAQHVRPAGSGLHLDRIITVTVPPPWPKPALKHGLLAPAVAACVASPVRTRLFAVEPGPQLQREFTAEIITYDRDGVGALRSALSLTHDSGSALADGIAAHVESIAATPAGQIAGAVSMDDESTLLICTQGSHDQCCGIEGEALAEAVAGDPSLAQRVSLQKVSHTGGHRFAPTLMELPTGRMWAFADLALVERLIRRTETAEDVRERCRGWWGATTGICQVAEIEARATFGAPFTEAPEITAGAPDDPIRVTHGELTWDVEVVVGRQVPVISCGAPSGEPVKPGREFHATVV